MVRYVLLYGVLFALAGCQTLDTAKPAEWTMQGSMIIRTSEQADRINIAWRQYQGDSEILLTGPLGTSIARIAPANSQSGLGYVLERPGEAPMQAASLIELVELVLGLSIPITEVMAVLSGDSPGKTVGAWQLETTQVDEQERPKRIEITGPGVDIRLNVRTWL